MPPKFYSFFDSLIHLFNKYKLTGTGNPKIKHRPWPLPLQNLQSSNREQTKKKKKKKSFQKFLIFEVKESESSKDVNLIKHHAYPHTSMPLSSQIATQDQIPLTSQSILHISSFNLLSL